MIKEYAELLSADEERRLLKAWIVGKDQSARAELVRCNTGLVYQIAARNEFRAMEFEECVQEGSIGLLKAIDTFDMSTNYRLTTYAFKWIWQGIQRARDTKSRAIRLPVHMVDRIRRIRKYQNEIQALLGRQPTDAEIAVSIGLTVQQVERARIAYSSIESLDRVVDDASGLVLSEILEDERSNYDEAERELNRIPMRAAIEEALTHFSERDQLILKMIYGLEGNYPHQLAEIGRELGLSRERVRQIQENMLKRLRRMHDNGIVKLDVYRVSDVAAD